MTPSIAIARYLFCAEERSPLRRRSWLPEKRFPIGAFASRPVVLFEPRNSGDCLRLAACSARGVSDWQLLFIPGLPFRFPPFLVHRFGAFPSPSGTRSSASLRALRVPVPPNTNSLKRQRTRVNFFRFPPKKQTFGTWEPGHSRGFAMCAPSQFGSSKRRNRHVSEQNHSHRFPRQ